MRKIDINTKERFIEIFQIPKKESIKVKYFELNYYENESTYKLIVKVK